MDPNKRRKIEVGNAFSALQNLSRSGDSPSVSVQSSPARIPRSQVKREQSDDAGPSRSVKYSSFYPTKSNYRERSDGVTELRLEQGDRFVVLGSFKIKVLEGEVVVAGASLRPSEEAFQIHAPHCHAVPVLRIRKTTRLQLHEHPGSRAMRQLSQLSPYFRNIWNEPANVQELETRDSTFRILYSSDDAPRKSFIQELVSPPQWNRKLASLLEDSEQAEAFTALICGPKSAGKSTFCKILTNRLLTRSSAKAGKGIMILDLDPGQPEYSLPGTVSLVHVLEPNLSPSFINVNLRERRSRLVRCHALAAITPAANTDLYQEAASDLFRHYKADFNDLPLIINTPGWILGTGLELLEDMILQFSPKEVVYMSEDGPVETVEALRSATKSTFTTLPSQSSELAARTGAHLRAMSTMSYFHSRSGSIGEGSWYGEPLSVIRPWEVAFSGPNKGILGIISYDYQAPPNLLAEAINGMVLALVAIEDVQAYRPLLGSDSNKSICLETPEGIPYMANADDVPLDPRFCRTLGLVLIRGIDKGTFQVLSPIPFEHIEESRKERRDLVLLYGRFDTPDWAYKEDLYYGSKADNDEDDLDDAEMELKSDATAEIVDSKDTRGRRGFPSSTQMPWIEVLKGNEKRPIGSKVWRVRRDLGKNSDG